ncbi:MAG: hypothetical protein ACI8PZ_003485, partial [Myxococcota bacterium]
AAPLLYAAWESTPTSEQPIRMETAERHIPQHPSQIEVTRNGTVDWRYPPYEEGLQPDGEVADADGNLTTFDEFNAKYGYVFCGTGDLDFPVGKLNTDVYPYTNCMDVELISRLLLVFFQLEESDIALPLPESLKAGTSASRLGPIRTLSETGEQVDRDLLMGFFPGEPTSLFTQHFRHRAATELGYEFPMMVGYSQDHEGYLLLPEDWLVGGYEPDIGLWGPLQGEHLLERWMEYVDLILSTDVHDDPDPLGRYAPTAYPVRDLPTATPDPTPTAGTWLDTPPEYFWMPMEMELALGIPDQVARVQDVVKFAWIGGDPMVDIPTIHLERDDGAGFVPVSSRSGRPVTSELHDFLVGHTPDPLYPFDADQTHYRVGVWQAVGHVHDRAGLPLGTYRLRITGDRYTGADATWPWTTTAYELLSEPFEVVPAALTVSETDGGLLVSLPGPAEGFRYVSDAGGSRGDNPIVLPALVTIDSPAGPVDVRIDEAGVDGARTLLTPGLPDDWTAITVEDAYGNTGTLTR